MTRENFIKKLESYIGVTGGTDAYWQNPPTREQLATILYRYHTKT